MGKRGPKPMSVAELKARGSRHARRRERSLMKPPRKPRAQKQDEWKPPTHRQLDSWILKIPGFDPQRESKGCWFDDKTAIKALKFFETELHHVEGSMAGKPFILEIWEKAIVCNLFGWLTVDDEGRTVRRFREAFIYIARKNGKTPLAAGICLYLLFEDGEAGAQIVSAAAERNQAALLFRHARGMVARSPYLERLAHVFGGVGQRAIVLKDDPAASYFAISADAFTKHGLNLSGAVVDELHAQPNRDLVDTLQTSMASANRAQPLMVFITTADFMRESICNEKLEYARKVRDGVVPDSAFLPVIFEVPRDADWTDPKQWPKANPNIDVSVSRDYLERECKRAKETPTYENTFRRLHLNQQTETDVRWLPMDKWDLCCQADPLEWRKQAMAELQGQPCYGGLDLSTSLDITAFLLAFDTEDAMVWLPFFWIPSENAQLREKRDRVPYVTWSRLGYITMTPGEVVDYDIVRRDINALGKQFDIRKIARDRWNASQITSQLMGDGFEVVDFGQGFASMSAPSKELEKLLIGQRLDHGNNPVLRWMARNAAAETDAAGNIKPSKKKSTERIDGIVAGVMTVGLIIDPASAEGPSVYENAGQLAL